MRTHQMQMRGVSFVRQTSWGWGVFLILSFLALVSCKPDQGIEERGERITSKMGKVQVSQPTGEVPPSPSPEVLPPLHFTKSLSCVPASTPPVIDGKMDPVWEKAVPYGLFTLKMSDAQQNVGRGTPIELRLLSYGDEIYFLVRWSDTSSSRQGEDWWNKDRLAFHWNTHSRSFAQKGCTALCHFAPIKKGAGGQVIWGERGMWFPDRSEEIDRWVWEADPSGGRVREWVVGYLDPQVFSLQPPVQRPSGAVELGGSSPFLSRALYENGLWTLEIKRKLKTGNPRQVQFAPGRTAEFGMSVFDASFHHHYSGLTFLSIEKPEVSK